jgi:hypothetical protein
MWAILFGLAGFALAVDPISPDNYQVTFATDVPGDIVLVLLFRR